MFKEAFKNSLENAALLEIERKQINEVFQELTSQILEASEGKITLSIRTKIKTLDAFHKFKKNYIVAHSKTAERELCEYGDNNGGFPVKLYYSSHDTSSCDKEALVITLQELLSSAHAGLIFKSLLSEKHQSFSYNVATRLGSK